MVLFHPAIRVHGFQMRHFSECHSCIPKVQGILECRFCGGKEIQQHGTECWTYDHRVMSSVSFSFPDITDKWQNGLIPDLSQPFSTNDLDAVFCQPCCATFIFLKRVGIKHTSHHFAFQLLLRHTHWQSLLKSALNSLNTFDSYFSFMIFHIFPLLNSMWNDLFFQFSELFGKNWIVAHCSDIVSIIVFTIFYNFFFWLDV